MRLKEVLPGLPNVQRSVAYQLVTITVSEEPLLSERATNDRDFLAVALLLWTLPHVYMYGTYFVQL